jgi:hypothetical protein
MDADNTKAFTKLVKRIEKSNEVFKTADRATKILMVAKDVLALLKVGRIQAMHGAYIRMRVKQDATGQISDAMKDNSLPACRVCAIGAGMIGSTLRLNDVKINRNYLYATHSDSELEIQSIYKSYNSCDPMESGMSDRAREMFPHDLLRNMETAFEQGRYDYSLVGMGEERLAAIYQNLVKNKGKQFTSYNNKEVIYQVSK